ncbi:MAG TPA: gamma-glutamyl-gamma-aminobutyrate hydrolase family protein [Solirubrobacteraceae bacterium]|nr:gamma-glutamyl-gamma-aminobutyrate hydrolase family protein [Solirubrobacteraceae bacterium]
MSRPLIGVTTSELRSSGAGTLRRHGEPPHAEMALGMSYLRAIEASGGLPVVLPPLGDADAFLCRLDAICLSGGPDLDPAAYGAQERHQELGPTEPGLDAFELDLARAADARGMPILGICRGAQALNVARGGTLHQHLPGHRQVEPATATTHTVHVEPGSRLAGLVGTDPLRVNSFHHQAVDDLGRGLLAVARAADGIVEAVEDPGPRFVVGVQWHAEGLTGLERHRVLFEALVAAAAVPAVPLTRAA